MILGIFSIEEEEVDAKIWLPYKTVKDGKKSNDETILQKLIFEKPKLFPVKQITDTTDQWIPLAREVDTTSKGIGRHGILDILATDGSGNIYIVECKLRYNKDMKSIRGQITDYASAIYRHFKISNDNGWKWFKNSIDNNTSINGTLENILDKAKVPIDKTIESMKKNLNENRIILVFAVDAMTAGLWDAVDMHNNAINTEHNYPCFAIEVRRYSEKANNMKIFVGVQTYPFDLKELIQKKSHSRGYFQHNDETFQKQFEKSNLTEPQIQIFNHAREELEKIADIFEYNRPNSETSDAAILPRFQSIYEGGRSPLTLDSKGNLTLQFEMLHDYIENKGTGASTLQSEIFKNSLSQIPEIKKQFDEKPQQGTRITNFRLKPEIWMPVYKDIFKALEEIT
jgi:thiamine phosphate synthase YjbQ (UPF0047 family)